MGGPGSGVTYRWGARATVEGCRRIDVRQWQREGLLRGATWFTTTWTYRDGQTASIGVQSSGERIVLRYTSTPRDAPTVDVVETVELTWTRCAYGGTRPWFVCPGVVNGVACMRRCAV